jgi:predicted aspartyl protease
VRAPDGAGGLALDGKIDTASDLCAVPQGVAAELDLPPVRTVRAHGFSGPAQEAIVYRIDLELAGVVLPRVEAIATTRRYALIGRNALRAWILRLDGPREILEIRSPRRRAAR